MTPKGAQLIIENLSLRIFEIQERRFKLDQEEAQHRARIIELEKVRDANVEIVPTPTVVIGNE